MALQGLALCMLQSWSVCACVRPKASDAAEIEYWACCEFWSCSL